MQKLPIISTLSPSASAEYLSRVSAWLSSDRTDLAEGVLLCSAIPQAGIFVDYATAYTSEKRRSEIVKYLSPIVPSVSSAPSATSAPSVPSTPSVPSKSSVPSTTIHPIHSIPSPSPNPSSGKSATSHQGGRGESLFTTASGTIYTFSPDGNVTAVGGNRPSHFDEWLNRMPADLQDKIATLKDNFTNLVEYRRKVEALAADHNHSKSDLSRYARLAVAYEARNLNIFAQADICWDELCGRPVSPDLKRELVQEERKLIKDIQKEGGVPSPTPSAQSSSSPAPSAPSPSSATSTQESVHTEAIVSPSQSAISPDQAQKYIRDKFDPDTASPSQREKAAQYARLILSAKGKLSKKVAAKLAAAGISV